MKKNYLFGVGILLVVLLAFAAPAAARTDNVTFYLNASDGSHEISVEPGEEVTIHLDAYAPVNTTGGFEVAVMFDPDVLECLEITENASVTDWMLWTFRGVWDNSVNPDLHQMNFDAMDFSAQGPGLIRCGDMRVRGVDPGVTTLYLGVWPDDVLDGNNRSSIADAGGDPKDWTLVELTFTCLGETPEPPETFTKDLASGWNLVSLPLIADDNNVSAVLNSISGNYGAVKSYNAATHQFEDATTMDPGVGYFVNVTTAGTWEYEGTTYYTSMTASLSEGLNCVGWVNETGSALPGALNSIADDYRYVARWNADDQKYEVYLPGVSAVFNDFEAMDQGDGYFIVATEDCTLTYP